MKKGESCGEWEISISESSRQAHEHILLMREAAIAQQEAITQQEAKKHLQEKAKKRRWWTRLHEREVR